MQSLIASTLLASSVLAGAPDIAPLAAKPRVILDLKTAEGAEAVSARWSVTDVDLVPIEFPSADRDGRSAGPPAPTLDIHPRVGTADFASGAWRGVSPTDLETRRGGGKVSFLWYRLQFTTPDSLDGFPTTGATLTLDLRIDDYAEVWVNGALPYRFGASGGAVVAGWNASNRLLLTSNATPGETFDIAIFASNGPVSESPGNYIWVREAQLEMHANPHAVTPETVSAEIIRFDPRLDAILPAGTAVERIATGFVFTEGPVWDHVRGELLFSDPNENTIYAWAPAGGMRTVLRPSGYDGADVAEYRQPGSNGLTFDNQGRLTINQHGNRRVVRREPDGSLTVLADRYKRMRLNSPNDLVYRSDGALYFTDPPFGLPLVYEDPLKETPFSGVYRLDERGLRLLTTDLKGANGIAFNHKETHLYVGDWDESRKAVWRYPVLADGTLGAGAIFADLTSETGDEAIDGVKVDSMGNVYVCGPGGLWIFDADGVRLGMLRNVETPHNIAFGDADGRTLYLTCHSGIYRVRLGVAGPVP